MTSQPPTDDFSVILGVDFDVTGAGLGYAMCTIDPETGVERIIGYQRLEPDLTIDQVHQMIAAAQAERATVNPPPAVPAVDILERIDAAVEGLCACGCQRPLFADGPSGYFASQECQARWHAAQALDPADVYDRPDAAAVYVGADRAPVPLTDDDTPDTVYRVDDNVYGTACRQQCPRCSMTAAYWAYFDDDDDCDRPSDECRLYRPPPRCPRCDNHLTDWRYVAAAHDHGPILLFELYDGTSRTHRRMPARRLHRAPDRRQLIDLTWEAMRNEVDRFTRAWLGQRDVPVINPAAAFRIVGPA